MKTNNATTSAKILAAAVYGAQAFKSGKKCIPCQDAKLLGLLVGNQVGEGLQILKAWSQSWHATNLAH